jgi:hypothetical protein
VRAGAAVLGGGIATNYIKNEYTINKNGID